MNIVFVHDHEVNPSKGGMQRVSWLLAGELRRRGHSVSFLSLADAPEPFARQGEFPQLTIPVLSLSREEARRRLAEFTTRSGIDLVVLQHMSEANLMAMHLLPEGVRSVMVYHMQPFSLLGKERKVKSLPSATPLRLKGKVLRMLGIVAPALFRVLYRRQIAASFRDVALHTERLVMLSERFLPRLFANTPGLDPDRVVAVNNPLTFEAPHEAPDLGAKRNVVLQMCRAINPQKNLTGFVEAWGIFHRSHPDWEAVLVGDGVDLELVKRYAQRRGVSGIRFEGNREDVERYYREAKIFCLTSTFEGWGMVLVEAMAFGCVPVAFDSYEAMHDIVADGENGLIVPPFSAAAMAAAMARLADNPDLWRRMALQGPASIRRFGIRDIVDEWEDKILNRL
ncbi:MAG: glycosyltransferase [Muribaculaceae bacterium]|nr:glycosyltransferase [Muribaculaceae bacterium]